MAATTAKPVRIFQEIELSFTENLIPVQIPVKQFDNQARKVRCRLYQNSVEYVVQEDTIVSYSGTRPDGAVFQYSSESRPELVFVDSGTIILTVTSFMTEVYGRFPIDIYLLSDDGDVLGMFNLTLNVARAAITNRKIASLSIPRKHRSRMTMARWSRSLLTSASMLVWRIPLPTMRLICSVR